MTKPADIGTNADIVRIRLESAAEKLNEALTLYQSAAKNHLSYNGSISRSYYAILDVKYIKPLLAAIIVTTMTSI